jgi:hypothetical protein
MQLARAILFGKDSISTGTSNAKVNVAGTNGRNWGIRKSTPGLISFAMIGVG